MNQNSYTVAEVAEYSGIANDCRYRLMGDRQWEFVTTVRAAVNDELKQRPCKRPRIKIVRESVRADLAKGPHNETGFSSILLSLALWLIPKLVWWLWKRRQVASAGGAYCERLPAISA